MPVMMKRLSYLIILACFLTLPASAQGGELLSRINDLRVSLGLSGYTTNSALASAAQNHAAWMVNTGKVSHTQDDGSGPRSRAQAAGYSSSFVSENIYMGADSSINTAWNFWINSPVHYAGMTSPNYNNIGIGIASGANGYAFVVVFGNAEGSLPRIAVSGNTNNQPAAASAPPSFVVGVDGIGNIMHEVQPGDTIGEIALIYGYTWEDIPYMLGINGMGEDDLRLLEIGSVFLVPPQDGTYTPSPQPATHTPTVTKTATVQPETATESALVMQMVEPAIFVMPSATPTPAMMVRSIPTLTPTATAIPVADSLPTPPAENNFQMILIVAVVLQVGIIGFATLEFWRRSH